MDPEQLSDEQARQLLDAIMTLHDSAHAYVFLPELDRVTGTPFVPVDLILSKGGKIELVPPYIAGFPVRVTVREDVFDDGRVVALPKPGIERSTTTDSPG